jgi:peptidoglycan/LPS O-acetylase OafA/YrhL
MSAVTFVEKVAAQTPANRDRAIDGLRALATLGVVVGHWLVGVLVLAPEGALRIASPLHRLSALAPASWFLQMLGLFFLVGGYSAALSLRRSSEQGVGYGAWLRGRFVRLGRPVVAVVALSAAALATLGVMGVPPGTLRTWIVLLVQPLWFIGIYGAITLLTKYAMAADRKLGVWAAAALLATVAVVDVLRYGPWQESMPSWIGLVNLLPGWLFAYQLGVSWASGRLRRAGGWVLLVGGVALFALLVTKFGYPTSMVGVPGAGRTNSHPPSLLVLALAAAQSGAAILLHARINQWLRRPRLWAGVVVVNLSAMTIFCWHQIPLVLVSMVGGFAGGLPGLNELPTDPWWVLERLVWLPVMAVVFAGIIAVTRRFDAPWTGLPRGSRVLAGALAIGFVAASVALY